MGGCDDPLVGYEDASTEMRFVNPHRYLEIIIMGIVFLTNSYYLPARGTHSHSSHCRTESFLSGDLIFPVEEHGSSRSQGFVW